MPWFCKVEFANQCAIRGECRPGSAARLRCLHKGIVHGNHEDRAGLLKLGVVDVAGDVGGRTGRAWLRESGQQGVQSFQSGGVSCRCHLLNAAGTPTMTPLPESSLARLTLLPGEFSTRSMLGMESPFRTKAGAVLWKGATPARGRRVARRRAANMARIE